MSSPSPTPEIDTRLSATMFSEWLQPLVNAVSGFEDVSFAPGRIPDMPSRCVIMNQQPGGGEFMEGLFEHFMIHIRCRGLPNNLIDAENISKVVDRIIYDHAGEHIEIGGVLIISMYRKGGAPQQMPINDATERFNFTCNYTIDCSVD